MKRLTLELIKTHTHTFMAIKSYTLFPWHLIIIFDPHVIKSAVNIISSESVAHYNLFNYYSIILKNFVIYCSQKCYLHFWLFSYGTFQNWNYWVKTCFKVSCYIHSTKLGYINLHYHQQWFEKERILPPFKMVFSFQSFCGFGRQTNKLISNFLLILFEFHWLQWHWIFFHIHITICASSV